MIQQRSASVSLVMIVRDEAHQLGDCLKPVAQLFDEIVIVDTGSRDATREVARQFTPKTIDFAWRDDFSAARNESLRHATGDWIFWLDADDRLTPENVEGLGKLFNLLNGRPMAFLMDTICRASFAGDLEQRLSHPRLFRRHEALQWRRRIHERLDPWPAALGYEIALSDVRIDHMGYSEPALVHRKRERNQRLLRMEYAVNPDDPETLTDLGVLCMRQGKLAEARRHLQRLLQSGPESFVNTRRIFGLLVELAMHEGNFQQAVDVAAKALKQFPGDEYLSYSQSEALYHLGEYQQAANLLVQIIRSSQQSFHAREGEPNAIKQRLAPLGLGEALRMQGALPAAEWVLRQVADAYPNDPIAWQYLGRVYVALDDRPKFAQTMERLAACPQGERLALQLAAYWHLQHNELDAAEQRINQLIEQAPHMVMPRVMRAECISRRGAPLHDQLEAYHFVLRMQPGNARAAAMIRQLEQQLQSASRLHDRELCTSVAFGPCMPTPAVSA
jgi:tetratricopeptide (TPR) repeat protein